MPNKKEVEKRPITKSFWFNIGLILLICLALYWLFFLSLGWFTRHNQYTTVPDLKNKTINEAIKLIKDHHLNFTVDSTYMPGEKPLKVLNQQPDPSFKVKPGHTVFLTVNKIKPPLITMPELRNLSYRSALMLLKSSRLTLKDTIGREDAQQGKVLDQLINGVSVAPRTEIPQGSQITLVVGNGLGHSTLDVPNVVGMSAPEASAILTGSNLQCNIVYVGTITDKTTAIVYQQDPTSWNEEANEANTLKEGENVKLYASQDGRKPSSPDDSEL